MSTSTIYFFFYNLLSWFAWVYLFYVILLNIPSRIPTNIKSTSDEQFEELIKFYHSTINLMLIVQTIQCIEIFHAIFGVVRSNPFMVFMQLGGRLHCLLIPVLFPSWETSLDLNNWISKYLFIGYLGILLNWTLIELIRYPFYICKILSLNKDTNLIFKLIHWLRYTLFIPLYPIGIASEFRCYYGLIQWLNEMNNYPIIEKYQYNMPNRLNWEITLKGYLYVFIIFAIIGGMSLYQHMMAQRRKAFRINDNLHKKKQ